MVESISPSIVQEVGGDYPAELSQLWKQNTTYTSGRQCMDQMECSQHSVRLRTLCLWADIDR